MRTYLALSLAVLALPACKKSSEEAKPGAKDPGAKDPGAKDPGAKDPGATGDQQGSAQGDGSGAAPAAPDATPAPKVVTVEGFETPESVLYDAAADVYLVSNIAGSPGDKDGNGFISRITPDDGKVDLKWIDSAKEGVTLDAPKGLAIIGDVLYVADIDKVRMFDRTSGEPKGEISIPSATFLNDLAGGEQGPLWASDTGVKFGANGPEPTGTDAIYRITPGSNKVEKMIVGKELGNPNGVASIDEHQIWVVTFGSGEIYKVVLDGPAGARQDEVKLPKGQLDGVVVLPGKLLVSSWEASAVFAVAEDGTATELITGVEAPADIGYDTKRNRVLIPLFMKNVVQLHPMP